MIGLAGLLALLLALVVCVGSLPWTLRDVGGVPAYNMQIKQASRLPPWWWPHAPDEQAALRAASEAIALKQLASARGVRVEELTASGAQPDEAAIAAARPRYWLGTDVLGRDLLPRCLVGGAISLGIGLAAACVSVLVGTLYGAVAGFFGGRLDALMMRSVDVLYGLPSILLIVLLAVAANALVEEWTSRAHARAAWTHAQAGEAARARGLSDDHPGVERLLAQDQALREQLKARADAEPSLRRRELSDTQRVAFDLVTLLVAIGGVSWLTMARVVRGQVLSLKAQPFMEAARAIGASPARQFLVHLLPNLMGPIIVYATLTVPQAILQESFLSFLGIGVKPPLPSWGNLAADALEQVNPVRSRWWMLLFPCLLLAGTLLALNFVGDALRAALDPRSRRR
jgi:oligopeptide transport system permease protein